MPDKLSEAQLEAIVAQQIELAKSHDTRERATARDKALDYYFGRMDAYVPPEANRSKVVSRDLADAIGWLMPEFMRIFTASSHMFVAEPAEPEDLSYSEDATEGLNYIFWKENEGYQNVYDGTWDALMHGDGIVKTFWDEAPVYGPAKFHDALTEDERAMLLRDDDTEVLAQTENAIHAPDPMTGQPVDVTTYDMKVRRKKADGRYVVTVIPPEDFLMDADAITVEDAAFKSHWQRKTRSDLVAMGYDKDEVWRIPEASRNETPEAQARRLFANADATDKSMQLVDYHECFVMVDVDGDGVAEMVRACYGGSGGGEGGQARGALLDWEVWEDEDPFDNIPCEPIPHRFGARSIADEEIDIQDVKTVLTRQYLNNTYWVNNPQNVVTGKVKNPESLTDGQFGQPVFADQGTVITPLVREYIGDKALQGIHYMDEVSSRRTGINSQSMALDPEVLQNQSATANNNAMAASRSQPELIARNMAQGWSKVGRKLLRLMNKHDGKPRTILVKGKPVTIEPRKWNTDMHVNINTGLGTGSRDKDAMMLGQVLQQQLLYTDRIAIPFPEKALDMLPYIHTTVTQFCESGGLKNPELYWPEISDEEIAAGKQQLAQRAQQPDPKIQADMAKTQAQLAAAKEQAQIQAQGDVVKNQAELQADLQTREADRQSALQELAVTQQFEREKMQLDYDYKMAALAQTREIELLKLDAQSVAGPAGPDGKPGKPVAKNKGDLQSELLMSGLMELRNSLAALHEGLSRPKSITTPDGRVYTAQVN